MKTGLPTMRSVRGRVQLALAFSVAGCVLAAGIATVASDAAAEIDSAVRPQVSIRPFHTGTCQLGEDHLFGADHSDDDRVRFVIYSFLVEGADGQRALIDLGPKTTEYCNRMFVRYNLFRDLGSQRSAAERFPDNISQPYGNVFDQLRSLHIAPSAVNHLVFSHLHADHHGMDDATDGGAAGDFPNALMHVSAVGWNDNVSRRVNGQWNSYVDYAFSDFLVEAAALGRVKFEDSAEVMPGMRTLYLGGHCACSQAVLLDTAAGLAVVTSDEVYLYRLLENDILPRIRTSEAKYRAALDQLARLALDQNGILVAMHDPLVWETYERAGTNWLLELKTISDRAVRGYARRRAWYTE